MLYGYDGEDGVDHDSHGEVAHILEGAIQPGVNCCSTSWTKRAERCVISLREYWELVNRMPYKDRDLCIRAADVMNDDALVLIREQYVVMKSISSDELPALSAKWAADAFKKIGSTFMLNKSPRLSKHEVDPNLI
jgi:hypothetical protein